ncbi:hypothetical protein [Proteus sp. FME41]|uniref:hypothetical protein n=1 Tax=Proteus sp. FME41 TaxID=2742608 RepID=UPI001D02E0F3|nr:hypothetical protein [Proteus sp. FME41]
MQKNKIKQCITLFSASLLLWLIWGFWSFGKEISFFLTAFICVITLTLCIWLFRQQKNTPYLKDTLTNQLPPDNYQGAVVIVCGQSHALFKENQIYRETAKGWYICASSPLDLINITQYIVDVAPLQLSRLSLLYALLPEQLLQQEDVTQEILNWRRAINESNKKVGKLLPFWITLYLNSPVNYLNSHFDDTTPWITYLKDQQELRVISDNLATQPISTWLSQNTDHVENQLTMALWIDQLLLWLKTSLSPSLQLHNQEPLVLFLWLGPCSLLLCQRNQITPGLNLFIIKPHSSLLLLKNQLITKNYHYQMFSLISSLTMSIYCK